MPAAARQWAEIALSGTPKEDDVLAITSDTVLSLLTSTYFYSGGDS